MSDAPFDTLKDYGFANSHEETPRQQVSNRSILRVQQLSNELQNSLKEMELFRPDYLGDVTQVLFAARDYRKEQDPNNNSHGKFEGARWYNFRLCANYGFATFKESQDKNRLEYDRIESWYATVKSHIDGIKALFEQALKNDPHTAARFDIFLAELDAERNIVARLAKDTPTRNDAQRYSNLDRRAALDQLLIALAVIPYRGVLLSMLEEAFGFPNIGRKPKQIANSCVFFEHMEKSGEKPSGFRLHSFDGFKLTLNKADPNSMPPIILCGFEDPKNLGKKGLFEDFLLPFTRGAGHRNRMEVNSDIKGFAIPAYDLWSEGKWKGGMLGWLVVFLAKTADRVKRISDNEAHQDLLKHSWLHFTDLVRSYVRRVREANIRDLLEDYAEPDGTHELPREYFLKHIHQVIGFKTLSSAGDQKGREEWQKFTVKRLVIPEDTHREEVVQDVIPLPHTCWDSGAKSVKGTTFPPGTRRLCAMFLDELELVRAKREEGVQRGESTTFHDYSKDLNVLEDQLYRYSKDVRSTREAVERQGQALLALESLPPAARDLIQRVADEVKRLGDPNFDYMLRLQLLMSHLRVKTEGRLYEAPEFAWRWLESGTRGDIYLILRAFVWRPFGWRWYDERLKSLPESVLDDDAMTWTRLFLFDEDREESEPRVMAGSIRNMISQVFRKLFFQWDISKADYEASFPPPDLNPDADWRDRILWTMDDASITHHLKWLPPVRLLPVFIFALRAAFEHAFLRNFMNVLAADSPKAVKGQKPLLIRIRESTGPNPGGARIHHRIHIAFPALGLEDDLRPLAVGDREAATLPYDNWSRHIDHYRHVSHPWRWQVERVGGKLDPNVPDTWHYEIILEARE